ncbi:MAG: SCO family protein [Saprospiraceae bacterium]
MGRIFRTIAITIFLVGFPMVSWYYLNEGYKYRIAIIKELDQNLGTPPAFKMVNQTGQLVDNDFMKEKVIVANFMDLKEQEGSKASMQKLYNIQDQFDKKDDILFYTYIKADALKAVQDYVNTLAIKEEKQWNFLTGTNAQMEQFIQAFPFPENSAKAYAGSSTVAIVDTSSTIRFFYDINNDKEVSKLIEHIANLMPQAPPEEARTKRELEK